MQKKNVKSSSYKNGDEIKQNIANIRNENPVYGQMEASEVFTKVSSLSSLVLSEKRCHKGVGYKNSVSRFHMLTLSKCYEIHKQMREFTYHTSLGDTFEIYEPKRRIVTTTKYKDRIPQSSFVTNYFYPVVAPQLTEHNFACLKGKGVELARDIFKDILKNAALTDYVLVADFKGYFDSINHNKLIEEERQYFLDIWAIYYLKDIIDANNKPIGITLGSEPNQLSAVTFPTAFDRQLPQEKYIRYMDDIRYVSNKKDVMNTYCLLVHETERLGIKISAKKTFIQPVTKPIKLLGFTFLKHPDGTVTMKRMKDKQNAEKRKLRRMKKSNIPFEQIQQHYSCVRANMKKGTRSSLFKLDRYYNSLFKEKLHGCN